jgi:ATP-binding cassette, subfamily B, bacterial CvaB/MchF/RaxB
MNQEALNLSLLPKNPVPVVLQAEAMECGLACLAMCLATFGREMSLAVLRTRYPASDRGTSFAQLADIGEKEGVLLNIYEADVNGLAQLQLPAILFWNNAHFVTLVHLKPGRSARIHDPAIGVRELPWAEFTEGFSGLAADVAPLPNFKKEVQKERMKLREFLRLVPNYKRLIGRLVGLSLCLELALIVSPLFLQTVVDEVLPVKDNPLLWTLATGFLLVGVIRMAAQLARGWTAMALEGLMTVAFKSAVFQHSLRLPLSWFEKRGLGTVVARFLSLTRLRQILGDGIVTAGVDTAFAVLMLAVMLIYAPMLALVTLGVSTLSTGFTLFLYRYYARFTNDQILADAEENNTFFEMIRGISTIKLFGREPQQQQVYRALMTRSTNRSLDISRLNLWHRTSVQALAVIEEVLIVTLAATLVLKGSITLGTMFGFYAYKQLFSTKLSALAERYFEFRSMSLHLDNVGDIYMSAPEPTAKEPLRVAGPPRIEIDQITFRYEASEAPILEKFSLLIEPGAIVGLTGPSGCGKSTLVRILTGAETPEEGAIRLNGFDLTRRPPGEYRPLLAVVSQEESLFTGTLAENITMFDERPDGARVAEALLSAGLTETIESLPMGLETRILGSSASLSGGQKQRIMLARAFYKNAPVLILDEATSALDVVLEISVSEAIRRRGLTTLVIAHRAETLARCDKVVELVARAT